MPCRVKNLHVSARPAWLKVPGSRGASCDQQLLCCAGSYSYVGLQASSKTYDDLAKPVQRRVLFAGEHTCKVPHVLLLMSIVFVAVSFSNFPNSDESTSQELLDSAAAWPQSILREASAGVLSVCRSTGQE